MARARACSGWMAGHRPSLPLSDELQVTGSPGSTPPPTKASYSRHPRTALSNDQYVVAAEAVGARGESPRATTSPAPRAAAVLARRSLRRSIVIRIEIALRFVTRCDCHARYDPRRRRRLRPAEQRATASGTIGIRTSGPTGSFRCDTWRPSNDDVRSCTGSAATHEVFLAFLRLGLTSFSGPTEVLP